MDGHYLIGNDGRDDVTGREGADEWIEFDQGKKVPPHARDLTAVNPRILLCITNPLHHKPRLAHGLSLPWLLGQFFRVG